MTDPIGHLTAALADRYDIRRSVGEGGMATVYLAHDRKHDREVALKVLKPDLAAMLGTDRFLQEIRIAAKLQHPDILPLYDSGSVDSILYYVMPFVHGGSLRARLNRNRTLSAEVAVAVAREVADALTYAHRLGIVHRDVKPENILFSEGHAVVADFGIARAVSSASDERLTRTGFAVGTPGYMSPEQAAGATDVGDASDVFSLACVVYEMFVGEVPARWITEDEVRTGSLSRAPATHRVALDAAPPGVEPALARAMAMDPEQRFATPMAFAEALEAPALPASIRRYGDTEAREILGRAAALEATERTSPEYSLSGVKRLGAEAEIPSRFVEAAAASRYEAPSLPRLFGFRAGSVLTQTVAGEVPQAEYPALLEIVQDTLGDPGRVDAAFWNMFVWSSDPSDAGKRGVTRVQVSPRDGRTRITITDDRRRHTAVVVGLGTVIGGLVANVVAIGAPLILLSVLAVAAVGGGTALRVESRKQRARLDRLLARLVQHVSATAHSPLGRGDIPSHAP